MRASLVDDAAHRCPYGSTIRQTWLNGLLHRDDAACRLRLAGRAKSIRSTSSDESIQSHTSGA
jgi:hypothetical protein